MPLTMQRTPNSTRNLPTITNYGQLMTYMKRWQTALSRVTKVSSASGPPLNFTATSAQGGVTLSWAKAQPVLIRKVDNVNYANADGYQLLVSPSGDFVSDVNVIKINDINTNKYFHATPVAQKLSFKIQTTSGTPHEPQIILGGLSGTVAVTSINANDTTTKPTTSTDNYTGVVYNRPSIGGIPFHTLLKL